jgi:hypothetical protein
MSVPSNLTATLLFKEWRSGKPEAGQQLAQLVSDWFYAICSARFGESGGHHIFQTVSQQFGDGIVGVSHSSELVSWAHGLLLEEISKSDLQSTAENTASAYSGGHLPADLLLGVRAAMPSEVALLNAFYSHQEEATVDALAADLGGLPGALLHARYAVKGWLKEQHDLPFEVIPDKPNMDLFPLPLYEAGQLKNQQENEGFETWMLDEPDICQDLAEFAPFASALRTGLLFEEEANPNPTTPQQPKQKARLGFADLTLFIGVGLVLVSFFAFAFLIASSME